MRRRGASLSPIMKLCLGAVAGGILGLLAIMLRAANAEWALDFRLAPALIELPANPDLAGIQTINLAPPGAEPLTAFYRLSSNGRTIILLHGTAGDRRQLLPEAGILARHGFGILNLDWPGHGGSGGSVHWDEGERAALRRAIAWVATQSNGAGQKIGVLAFSMGTWIALQVAVNEPRIGALVLTGAFADVKEALVSTKGRHFGWFVEWPTLMAAQAHGLQFAEHRSVDLIAQVAPRPVFLIAGSADVDVPADMTARLFAAAKEPKYFWLVNGASHGQYAAAATAEYELRLIRFFAGALNPAG